MAQTRLKSIKIFGFKSFAEETEIYFPKRFTVIVGPNGSGKSNILDAIRWVLGDQSYRMLRISEAADLIHQSDRKRINFASVKAVFSFNNEEVEIERRINRKGEVFYFKNGQEVRLKDIVEFLAKFKIGIKGFTAINQGMSDLFLRASPREKYEMLSEMFGTKFLEIKKKEAISNFESASKRYAVLEREISKIKPILQLYHKENEKLAKKQKLEEELKDLQSNFQGIEKFYLIKQYDKLQKEIEILSQKITNLDKELQELSQDDFSFPEEKLNQLQKRKIELLEKQSQIKKSNSNQTKTESKKPIQTILTLIKNGLTEILQMNDLSLIHKKAQELLDLFAEEKEPTVIQSEKSQEEKEIEAELVRLSREIALEENLLQEKRRLYQEQRQKILQKEKELARLQYEKQLKEKSFSEIKFKLEKLSEVEVKEGNLEQVRNKIEETKQQLWLIGSIHEGILQQGKEAEEKYKQVVTEIDDVKQSLQDLQTKINHYDKEIKTIFKMYLDRINIDLEKYFREFFGPGELKLILQDEEIHLSFKHEIKNLRTLESLSGGEKALISIILIFALIQIADPPFLILDEIDAPLDENNAKKFVQMIKNLSYRTQFIVITHNRVTMENAEAIYGISMNKEGVSKVFSLKLKQAEELIK